jgi:hypothetical protein
MEIYDQTKNRQQLNLERSRYINLREKYKKVS